MRSAPDRARRWFAGPAAKAVAAVGTIVLVVVLAIAAQGYDSQKTDPAESSVWVTRASGQYARVDTDLGQITTVQDAEEPSGVAQHGSSAIVYTQGFRKQWALNPANPAPLVDRSSNGSGPSAAAGTTPSGTRQVVSAGDWTAYLTDTGKVLVQQLSATGSAAQPVPVEPAQQGQAVGGDAYSASAIAVSDDGTVVLYSAREGAVRRYDASRGAFSGGASQLSSRPPADAKVLLTVVAGHWVLAAPSRGEVWLDGHDGPVAATLGSDGVAQQGSSTGDTAYFSDGNGLLGIRLSDAKAERTTEASGTPAAPVRVGGTVYAAWLGTKSGTLWSSTAGPKNLVIPDGQLDRVQALAPVIASNGRRAVLEETSSGLIWTVPDGHLIPLSQWDTNKKKNQRNEGSSVVQEVTQEQPPVAQASSFGVRAGGTAILPVLLNAYTPMKNAVLTIVPSSISGGLSTPGFGELSLTNDNQQIAVRVHAQSGTATFSYVVTDGQMQSAPAMVTLHVVPSEQKAAPVWCGIENCMQQWPKPSLAPGGTITVPVLTAWVDPDGDQLALLDARKDDPRAPIRVVPTADGKVAIRHTDPNAGAAAYGVTVTVADASGKTSTKQLTVQVAQDPPLELTPGAVVTGTGQPRTVAVADYVSGGLGSYRLADAAISSGSKSSATVVPNGAAGTVQFTAGVAGEYVVTYTVQDAQTQAEQTGILRFSVVAGASALSMPPIAAFVRPHEDTTLDVLQAVQNTAGRVLALASASADGPRLSVDVVDNDKLRVSGTTADGQPGRVGSATVVITDGAGFTMQGTVTVFLVPPVTGVGPIARPDAVTVRAGAQVDIPVTGNDIAPRGERVVLHPALQGSGAPDELAFVSGDAIRYLAPKKPGVYTLRYSEYLEADPSQLDSATVTVTVTPPETNHAPEPTQLAGRVVAGGKIVIPVPRWGMDPDGDPTVLAGIDQPPAGQGAASISADGLSITYTAPGSGVPGGQVSFGYTLHDPQGATGTGTVRVAVLGGQFANVSPVTYTDAIRAVKGASSPVSVEPLLNDRDPAGGSLSLVSVEPNAPPGTPEYERLKALIDPSTQLNDGVVRLRAGDVEGLQSYLYTVRSGVTSSTAQGLIVVTVAAGAAPDVPVVADTVVTISDRTKLADGIDVVAGKTAWASGDVDSLALAAWGDAAKDYKVSGHKISGPAPAGGAVVPFSLTGKDQTGQTVVGYGFLRIPAFDDMRLQLQPSLKPFSVGEEQTLTVAMSDAVDLGPGDRLQIGSDASFAVQRANARCTPSGDAAIDYSAGREAPWTDTCTVKVRVAGQNTWTSLPIPLSIVPKSPQALMNSVSRIVPPGSSQTIDLYGDMTSWDSGRVGDQSQLDYRVAYSGTNFTVVQSGRSVTVTAHADAHPGAKDTAAVSVTAFGGLNATISLVVGAAPPDAPRGATFSRACAVNAGPSCSVPLVGVPGEYDPFQGKTGSGLKLVAIGAANCPVANLSVSGATAVTAAWPAVPKPYGGTCIVPFTVADAQGRTGPGTLTLNVQGYPPPPSSVTTASYTGSSVTLLVSLGDSGTANPRLTGVGIYENGQRVGASCTPSAAGSYSCTVGGLSVGQRHTYTARSINAVGESVDTSPVVTWAYQAPVISGVNATTVYDPNRTNQSQGVLQLAIQSSDDTSAFQISIDGNAQATVQRTGSTTTWQGTTATGPRNVQVVPLSQFQPPLGQGNTGTSWAQTVTVAGSPIITSSGTLVATTNTSLEFRGVSASANGSSAGVTFLYAVWKAGSRQPNCSMNAGGAWQTSPDFAGLEQYQTYEGMACATNGFGATASNVLTAATWTISPTGSGTNYAIATSPSTTRTKVGSKQYTTQASYGLKTAPVIQQQNNFTVYLHMNGTDIQYLDQSTFGNNLSAQYSPGAVNYRYCFLNSLAACGSPSPITATTAPTLVTLSVVSDPTTTPKATDVTISGAAQGSATVTSSVDTTTQTITYHVTFSGAFASLAAVDLTRPYGAGTAPAPAPTP